MPLKLNQDSPRRQDSPKDLKPIFIGYKFNNLTSKNAVQKYMDQNSQKIHFHGTFERKDIFELEDSMFLQLKK